MSADPNVNVGLFTKTIYTVATLPAAASARGNIEWVSNSTLGGDVSKGIVPVNGGTFKCKVMSDGTHWRIFG